MSSSNPRIYQLDTLVANQIAAGEVIERPASIIKELVENSLDAKATQIDIDIEGSGVHLIRIRDNGVGIDKADLPLAFSRHATSKIRVSEDLFAIQSLGFRGEALASIAAVSRCRVTSCLQGQTQAWQLENTPTGLSEIIPAAHEVGTTVEVSDLFYNVPVRRKFLRSPKTEFQLMDEMIKRLALSHPTVRFKLTHQQRLIRHFPAVSAAITEDSRVAKICGQSFMNHALKITATAGDLTLVGWIGLPAYAHRQADCQYVFINQRMVKDRFIHHIIKTLFQQHPDYVEGSYPCYVLYLTIDPTQIDVNVHPTKQEVRFHQPRWVHDFISKAISELLQTRLYDHSSPLHPAPLHPSPLDPAPLDPAPLDPAPLDPAPLQVAQSRYTAIVPTPSVITASPAMSLPARVMPSAQRQPPYAFLQKDHQLYIIDLMRSKVGLLSAYCQQLQGMMPTKSLLFPEKIPKLSMSADLTRIQTTLAAWGFMIQQQDKDWVLLQQPKVMNLLSMDQLLGLIELCFKGELQATIADYLAHLMSLDCLYDLSVRHFEALLSQWIVTAPQDSYITHELDGSFVGAS